MNSEEFIYLHPEYNKEVVRGDGRGSEFECVCVCCVPMVAHIVETALCGYFKNSPPPEYANVPMPGKMQSSTVVAQLLG